MTVGFIVGKFYPPHTGHHYMIDTAMSKVDKLIVMVAWSYVESIPGDHRAQWIKERHPNAIVISVRDNFAVDYDDDTAWENHVNLFSTEVAHREKAHGWKITHFFSSELWGAQMAEMLSDRDGRGAVVHHMVDVDRTTYPVSATKVRADVPGMWEYLSMPVRRSLMKRVVICGGESTGTTTLAKMLAKELETVCVPEFGRHFDWAVNQSKWHKWTTKDFELIADQQCDWERLFAKYSGPVMVCDTDSVATEMFHDIYIGGAPAMGVMDITQENQDENPVSLYIITSHEGVEFEDDGTRYNSNKREWATEWLQDNLPTRDRILVVGTPEERLAQALKAVKEYIKWEFNTPLEYMALEALANTRTSVEVK